MKAVAIVQARMGSSRLPGKVLLPLAGREVLWHVVDRLRAARSVSQVAVATTTGAEDDALEQFCDLYDIACVRGSEQDVLDRYYQAARTLQAEHVLRITSDCPAIDPAIIDEVMQGYAEGDFDLYGLHGEFPDGLDTTVFSFQALESAWRKARLASEREHVCPYMLNHPDQFKVGGYEKFDGLAHHRWTLDEPADYQFLQAVFERLYDPQRHFRAEDVLRLLQDEPALMQLNQGIIRNEGYLKSLADDGLVETGTQGKR